MAKNGSAEAKEEIRESKLTCFFCKKVPFAKYGIYHQNCSQVFCKRCVKIERVFKCPSDGCTDEKTHNFFAGINFNLMAEKNLYKDYEFRCGVCCNEYDYNGLNHHFKETTFKCVKDCQSGRTYNNVGELLHHLKNDCEKSEMRCNLCD